jgi:sporulation protein YlmC with PRC-barrel domain
MLYLWSFDPTVDRDHSPLVGFEVMSADGTSAGKVTDAVDDQGVSFLVVDVGGMLRKKRVVVPAGLVKQINTAAERVFVRVDKETVLDAPEYEDDWRDDPTWADRTGSRFAV